MRRHGCRDLLICCNSGRGHQITSTIKRKKLMPISRREMVAGIATTLTTTPAGAKTDTELVALGKQFDALTRVLDAADLWGDMAYALDRIERAILNTQAKTMEG